MRKTPPTNEDGGVRELLVEDIKRFRPSVEVLSPGLSAKLGVHRRQFHEQASEVKNAGAKAAGARKRSAAVRRASQTRRQTSN